MSLPSAVRRGEPRRAETQTESTPLDADGTRTRATQSAHGTQAV